MKKLPLRTRILTWVGALMVLSLLGSGLSLYRISIVNQSLDGINQVAVPFGRLVSQMKSDAELLKREMERRLGYSYWYDTHWKAQPIPNWIRQVLTSELKKLEQLSQSESKWASDDEKAQWREWAQDMRLSFENVQQKAGELYQAIQAGNYTQASDIYPKWVVGLDDFVGQLRWGTQSSDRLLRSQFQLAQSNVSDLKLGLQAILIVVVALSFIILWMGERALRPLADLTELVKQIADRGLRKEDKSQLPALPLDRKDEVSQLAREFHKMATALLERERTVESQNRRLEEQNRKLLEMGTLNRNILTSIQSVLIVTNQEGVITQVNPIAELRMGNGQALPNQSIFDLKGSPLHRGLPTREEWTGFVAKLQAPHPIDSFEWEGRIYGGQIIPLHDSFSEKNDGAILLLDDLTEEKLLQKRLQLAENMAAVGRMSAHVAHEVRNPLHSIGLEAEMALERAQQLGDANLIESVQTILSGVDRLEKITQNYLRLSKLSSGRREVLDLGDVLESVLATYGSVCQAQGVRVDWSRMVGSHLQVFGDRDSLEQVFGNLLKNSLQAVEGISHPVIRIELGSDESGRVWVKFEDNGQGIDPKIRAKLFTPFLTTRREGTGLGLPYVKQVVEEHRGEIAVIDREKTNLKGAGFVLSFPSPKSDGEVTLDEKSHPHLTRG